MKDNLGPPNGVGLHILPGTNLQPAGSPQKMSAREYHVPVEWLLWWLQGLGRIDWRQSALELVRPPVDAKPLACGFHSATCTFYVALEHPTWPALTREEVEPIHLARLSAWTQDDGDDQKPPDQVAFGWVNSKLKEAALLKSWQSLSYRRARVMVHASHLISFLLAPLVVPDGSLSDLAPSGTACEAGNEFFAIFADRKNVFDFVAIGGDLPTFMARPINELKFIAEGGN